MPAAPRASAAPEGRGTRSGAGRGTGAAVALLLSGNSLVILDLGEVPVARVEELVVDRRPAAELVDREEARRRRVLRLVDERRLDRAVALAREDLLRRVGPEVVEKRLRRRAGALRDRGRVLDQDRLVRDRVVERLPLLLSRDRLVLVR